MAARIAARRSPAIRRRPHVVVLGDLVLDVVTRPAAPLVAGSDTPGTVRLRRGGSAANTAVWLVRCGVRASFIGAVGRDGWGRALVRALVTAGVAVHVTRVAAPTARLVALVAADGERSFVTDRGAADQLAPSAVAARWLRGADLLHLPVYSLLAEPLASAAARAAALAGGEGAALSVDLASVGPLRSAGPDVVAGRIARLAPRILLGTAAEAEAMTGTADPAALLDLAPLVVVKHGAAGCRVLTRDRGGAPGLDLVVPARALPAADTTGAGDAFDAGFLAAWVSLAPAERLARPALRRAALAGHRAAARLLTTPRPELRL